MAMVGTSTSCSITQPASVQRSSCARSPSAGAAPSFISRMAMSKGAPTKGIEGVVTTSPGPKVTIGVSGRALTVKVNVLVMRGSDHAPDSMDRRPP